MNVQPEQLLRQLKVLQLKKKEIERQIKEKKKELKIYNQERKSKKRLSIENEKAERKRKQEKGE